MKLQLFIFAILATYTFAQNTCHTLHDGQAKIWTGLLGGALGDTDDEKQATLDAIKAANIPEATSTCVASLNLDIFTALGLVNNCGDVIDEVFEEFKVSPVSIVVRPKYKTVVDSISGIMNSTSTSTMDKIKQVREYVNSIPSSTFKGIVSLAHSSSGLPKCLNYGIDKALFPKMFNNACCGAFKTKFSEVTGNELDAAYLKELLYSVIDIVFSNIQTGNGEISCAENLIRTLFDSNAQSHLTSFVQTPNDQACAASNGNPFQLTSGSSYTYPGKQGCCASTLDNGLQIIKNLPFVKSKVNAELFDDGKCWKLSDAEKQVILDLLTDAELKAVVKAVLDSACLHIANSFSSGCSFDPAQCSAVVRS